MDHVPGDFWSIHLLKVSLERTSTSELEDSKCNVVRTRILNSVRR